MQFTPVLTPPGGCAVPGLPVGFDGQLVPFHGALSTGLITEPLGVPIEGRSRPADAGITDPEAVWAAHPSCDITVALERCPTYRALLFDHAAVCLTARVHGPFPNLSQRSSQCR